MTQILCLCLVSIVLVSNVSSHPHLSLDSLDQFYTKNMEMPEPHTIRDRTSQDTSMQTMKDLPNMDTDMGAFHPALNNINHFLIDNMDQEPRMDTNQETLKDISNLGTEMRENLHMDRIVKMSENPEEESPILIPNLEFDDMSLMHKRDHRNEVSQEMLKGDSGMSHEFKMNTEEILAPMKAMTQVTSLLPFNALYEALPNQYGFVKDIYDGFIKTPFTGEDNMMPKLTTDLEADQAHQEDVMQLMPSSEMVTARTREFEIHHPDGMTDKKITSRQFRPTYARESDQLLNTIYKR